MATAANRFGLSALSRSNKSSAINEEILLEKSTGQMLNKSTTGDIISYDYNSRLRDHINMVSILGQTNAIRGTVNTISFDNLELPAVITESSNLLTANLQLKASAAKRFLVSVDVDTIETSTTVAGAIGQYEPTVTLGLQFTISGVNTTATVTGKLSEINTKVIDAANYYAPGTDLTNCSVTLTSITVARNSSYSGGTSLRHILHSVLIIVE
jgi:hypothetical protein